MAGNVPKSIRAAVFRRANGCCEYCCSQSRFATESFSIDHVLSRSRGGTSSAANLALSCQGCNNHRYNKTSGFDPLTNREARLFNPRRHRWGDHFTWSEDYTMIVGITPSGRATVYELQLNRPGVVELRRVLLAVGEHPPRPAPRKPR
jgi:hypothetical protein